MKDAWSKDEYLNEIDDVIRSLHNHLKKSTKATSGNSSPLASLHNSIQINSTLTKGSHAE